MVAQEGLAARVAIVLLLAALVAMPRIPRTPKMEAAAVQPDHLMASAVRAAHLLLQ
jgi:hypothetical protein